MRIILDFTQNIFVVKLTLRISFSDFLPLKYGGYFCAVINGNDDGIISGDQNCEG